MTEAAGASEPRWCYYVSGVEYDESGYIPSVVTEQQPGYVPLTGNGPYARPWYWGKTFEEAKALCIKENEKLGISEKDALDILMSSMRASQR